MNSQHVLPTGGLSEDLIAASDLKAFTLINNGLSTQCQKVEFCTTTRGTTRPKIFNVLNSDVGAPNPLTGSKSLAQTRKLSVYCVGPHVAAALAEVV